MHVDDIDELVDWQLNQCPPTEKPGAIMSWRGCPNNHAWQADITERPILCPQCGLPAT